MARDVAMPTMYEQRQIQERAKSHAEQCTYHDAECHVCRGGDDIKDNHCCAYCTEYPLCEKDTMCPGLENLK